MRGGAVSAMDVLGVDQTSAAGLVDWRHLGTGVPCAVAEAYSSERSTSAGDYRHQTNGPHGCKGADGDSDGYRCHEQSAAFK